MRLRRHPQPSPDGRPYLTHDAATVGDAITAYDDGVPIPVAIATQPDRIPFDTGWWEVRDPGNAQQPLPDPSHGGRGGMASVFGWSTGFAPRGTRTDRFTGRTLVPASTRPNPRYGHVGLDGRSDRLGAGVDALYADDLPDPATVAQAILSPTMARVLDEQGV